MSMARLSKGILIGAVVAATISAGPVGATTGTLTTSTLIGRATFDEAFHIKRTGADGWDVKVKATPALDIAVQRIVFQPEGQSGWHSHPGPVFISVVEGTMTFYESDDRGCVKIVRHAGEGYIDVGDHAHIARNETSDPATNVVTYLAPPGAALRIDEPKPDNCPF